MHYPGVGKLSGFGNTVLRVVYLSVVTADVRTVQSFSISHKLLFWSHYYHPRDHSLIGTEVHSRKPEDSTLRSYCLGKS